MLKKGIYTQYLFMNEYNLQICFSCATIHFVILNKKKGGRDAKMLIEQTENYKLWQSLNLYGLSIKSS